MGGRGENINWYQAFRREGTMPPTTRGVAKDPRDSSAVAPDGVSEHNAPAKVSIAGPLNDGDGHFDDHCGSSATQGPRDGSVDRAGHGGGDAEEEKRETGGASTEGRAHAGLLAQEYRSREGAVVAMESAPRAFHYVSVWSTRESDGKLRQLSRGSLGRE